MTVAGPSGASASGPTAAPVVAPSPAASAGPSVTPQEQLLIEALLKAQTTGGRRAKQVSIGSVQAEDLLRTHEEIIATVTKLAIQRAQALRSEHLESVHISFAVDAFLRGREGIGLAPVLNTVGGILLGVGLPAFISMLNDSAQATPVTVVTAGAGILLGSILTTFSILGLKR